MSTATKADATEARLDVAIRTIEGAVRTLDSLFEGQPFDGTLEEYAVSLMLKDSRIALGNAASVLRSKSIKVAQAALLQEAKAATGGVRT